MKSFGDVVAEPITTKEDCRFNHQYHREQKSVLKKKNIYIASFLKKCKIELELPILNSFFIYIIYDIQVNHRLKVNCRKTCVGQNNFYN